MTRAFRHCLSNILLLLLIVLMVFGEDIADVFFSSKSITVRNSEQRLALRAAVHDGA